MAKLPTGTVTYLFTDIEGSTRLLQNLGPDQYRRLQADHAALMRSAIAEGQGTAIRTEGDSFFAVFPTPAGGLQAAVGAQRSLATHPWPESGTIRVRMGLHTGEGRLGDDDYVGIDVNRAARIAAAGHGGQVILSDATCALVQHDLPDGVTIRDLGVHRLKDITHPEHLFDLIIDGLHSEFPELKTLDARPNNLPLQLTSFVGREAEVAETIRLLRDHRLVTLTGPGGTGKTRLAIAVAAELLSSFDGGAFFVDLAPIADPAQVCPAICHVLGVKEEPGSELIDTLVNRLFGQELLLVLDNFEHLLAAAPLVDSVLGRVADVRVLVTSRARLGLYGEQEQHVPPLALPDLRRLPELETLSRYEAVALFISRARAARANFTVTSANARAVAAICARLDGLPLAIELAASRTKILSPDGILSRLGASLDLLSATVTNVPERQRTLRAAIEWSFRLLEEPERRLFARLSAFAGGADLESVEAVGNPDGDLGVDTLHALSSLVDRSLVRQTETEAGEPRFGMLETIREYARERCEVEWDADATRHRHALHFLALAEASKPHLDGRDMVTWLDRLTLEHDNLQTALRWAIEVDEVDLGMSAAAAVWRFWQQRGHFALGRMWMERLLACPGPARSSARAKAYGAAGSLAYWQADLEATERYYAESLAIAREVGDRAGIAAALYNLGFLPMVRGSGLDRAIELFQEARKIYEEIGDEVYAARSRGDIGFALALQGQYERALPILEESIQISKKQGDLFYLADNLTGAATAHRYLGNHGQSRASFLEALELMHEADNPSGVGGTLLMLSGLESDAGRHDVAVRLFAAGTSITRSIGGAPPLVAMQLGDPEGAARQALGDEATDQALADGRAMSRDEAVAYARKVGAPLST
jgi:predicted ATPase/class 3 adenylate cyclase